MSSIIRIKDRVSWLWLVIAAFFLLRFSRMAQGSSIYNLDGE